MTGPAPAASADELLTLAKVAWRNNARCIGRLFWNTLEFLDARSATTSDEIFEACVEHLRFSTNHGKIRSAVTLFSPAEADGSGPRIWNRQLIRYAGYRLADGSILGDPEQAAFTERVIALGWKPPSVPGRFDLLPLVVQLPGKDPVLYSLPANAVLEVLISHPDLPWFADLGLKWHAVPVISDMALVGHGHHFTAAPFSGYYMGTEIASRNFGDETRYNLLPLIAEKMNLDREARRMLWKDRALVELNTAVIHSFREAGVAIVDHHTASLQFMQHLRNEEACGRDVPGDWSWLVPPMSGSACPVFHRYYSDSRPEPAFIEQAPAW
ncbi:nitric oxide synthase oxygenase [Luteolibacter sp. GHJ8]|uniref:Nitric oxide synthase oxygenase n=1 Tax=Luteolibacter rhizosphaerae TaxID=2989719 RepID=A0ABT3G5R8_9BACT|nr:nitric oxide synthase oxygenase [Luteolibacter rhizosphaerae]MCW1915165.1 nitric oxide synthase oxygenase [Luteolibacter rhizosphaerae]